MFPFQILLSLLFLSTAVVAYILAHERKKAWGIYIFKPLAIGSIITLALALPSSLPHSAQLLLFLALFFSATGDILLIFGQRLFIQGLFAFLFAHIAYLLAFTYGRDIPLLAGTWALIPILVMTPVLPRLFPHLSPTQGRIRPAVLLYIAALSTMFWAVLSRFHDQSLGHDAWLLGSAGAAAFVLSDTLLSFRRLAKRPLLPYFIESPFYFFGQWAIVTSTLDIF